MRKFIAIAGSLAVAAASLALPAAAQTVNGSAQNQMAVSISSSGRARVEGQVSAVSGDTISLKSWGGTWTANLNGNASVQSENGKVLSPANIKVGDKIVVSGKITDPASMTIVNAVARDVSMVIRDARKTVRRIVGTVENLDQSARSLVLKLANGNTVSVSLGSNVSLRTGSSTAPLANLSNGEHVQISGSLNSQTNVLTDTNSAVRVLGSTGSVSGHVNSGLGY